SRFWPADQYEPGKSQPSFDKQFVRDYLETLDWNKTPPGPVLPPEVVARTQAKYLEAYEKLTGKSLRRGLSVLCVLQSLVEDFLKHLRHERGQAENTQRTYAALLKKFVAWAEKQRITDWKAVEFRHLMAFLQNERERKLETQPKDSGRKLSSESVYL